MLQKLITVEKQQEYLCPEKQQEYLCPEIITLFNLKSTSITVNTFKFVEANFRGLKIKCLDV